MTEKPKFRIGDEVFTVTIWTSHNKSKVENWTVRAILLEEKEWKYLLDGRGNDKEFTSEYLYSFGEALDVMKTRKRPDESKH